MSKAVDLEIAITNAAQPPQSLSANIPDWMKYLGIQPIGNKLREARKSQELYQSVPNLERIGI